MSSSIGVVCSFKSNRRLCVAMGLLFFIGMNAVAQVTIKERMEIDPQNAAISGQGKHKGGLPRLAVFSSIRVEMSWDIPTAAARMYLRAPCLVGFSDTVISGTGDFISYTFTAPRAGLYLVSPQICVSPAAAITCSAAIYLNDSLGGTGPGN